MQVGVVDRPDNRRLGQGQEVVVAAEVARMVAEPGVRALAAPLRAATAEPRFIQLVGLDERAHRPIDHQYPLGEQRRE